MVMRIALAQINPTVGDIEGNCGQIRRAIKQGKEEGADLIVFPELSVIGYPPKDLLLKPGVIEACVRGVEGLAEACDGIGAVIGYPYPTGVEAGKGLYNAAGLCVGGRVVYRYTKRLLPTYDVFDERRYFEPGNVGEGSEGSGGSGVAQVGGVGLGVSICEDIWNDREVLGQAFYREDPIARLVEAGADVLVNCSASPYVVGKHALRVKLLVSAAKKHGRAVVFCNQVGGNDELVFDGHSCVVDETGRVIAQAKGFEADLLMVDLPGVREGVPGVGESGEKGSVGGVRGVNRVEVAKEGIESVYHALVLGLKDYCGKCGFESVVLGLSGGIDSAVTGALAVGALGAEKVHGVAMPSRYSSAGSVGDAEELAKRLGIKLHKIGIGQVHEALEAKLAVEFKGRAADTTEENIQARVRGVILMSLSNKFGWLVLTTGNKSELAVGYCTLYGDMCGGLAVLSDVPKTMVWELARWINESEGSPLRRAYGGAVIPESTITKAPSAELAADQKDQDTLPEYGVLDQIVERYVECDQPIEQIIGELKGVNEEVVKRVVVLIDRNEYKRRQAAPGLKITGRAFGFGRRMPIAQGWG